MENESSNRDEKGRWLTGHSEPGPGRSSHYSPEMNDQAYKLALLGLTEDEMAKFFEVSGDTITEWKNVYPAFSASIKAGREPADSEVAQSLYKQATGHFVTVEKQRKNKTTGEFEVVKVQTYIPGNPHAAQFWLKNRQKAYWRDKQDHVHGGDPDNPIAHTHSISVESVKAVIGEIDAALNKDA